MTERWDDISNYQWTGDGVANAALMQAIKDSGVIGLYIKSGEDAAMQWDAADRVGLRKRGYVYLNFPGGEYYDGRTARKQMLDGIATFSGRVIERVGIDCEDPGNTLNPHDTVDFIYDAMDACSGIVYSDIYTAPAWWEQYTGNTLMFSAMNMNLWLAAPTGTPPTSLTLPEPFGGWTQASMIQYSWKGQPLPDGPEVDEDEGEPE